MKLRRVVAAALPSFVKDAVRGRFVRRQQDADVPQSAGAPVEAPATPAIASWEDACARAMGGGYDSPWLTHFRIARARLHVPDGSLLRGNVLGLAARLLNRRDVRVTDLGGATGELGADFRIAWPRARYCVVETARLAAEMRAEPLWPGVRFATELPTHCDIFYSSGALQYLADPMAVWDQGLASAAHGAILRRNYFADDDGFDVQASHLFENGHGPLPDGFANITVIYPRRTLNEAAIHAAARRHGFDCIADLDEPGDGGRASRQLVFWRGRKPALLSRLALRLGDLRRRGRSASYLPS